MSDTAATTNSARATVELPGPIALTPTLRRFSVLLSDPTRALSSGGAWFAFRTKGGPATVRYVQVDECEVEVAAWGAGCEQAIELAPAHLGVDDRPEDFDPTDPILAPMRKRFRGLRFGRTGRVLDTLVPCILGQKVAGKGATRSWRDMVFRYGERAPAADPIGAPNLWIAPSAERLVELSYFDLHPLGVERKRAQAILNVAREAGRLERSAGKGCDALRARLTSCRGIGPWTAAIVIGAALGDADAVPVGDYHIPNMVTYAMTGERRGDDERMLELLEPFRPHRARVIAWLSEVGAGPPRRGPRVALRDIRSV